MNLLEKVKQQIREFMSEPDQSEFDLAIANLAVIEKKRQDETSPAEAWQLAYDWAQSIINLCRIEKQLLETIIAGHESARDIYEKRVVEQNEKKVALKQDWQDGKISSNDFKSQMDELDEPIKELELKDLLAPVFNSIQEYANFIDQVCRLYADRSCERSVNPPQADLETGV